MAVAAVLVVGHARIARAGCPGGGGGHGSGGGHGGGGGMAHGSWRAEPTCTDTSDVVGFRRCTKFATWSANLGFPVLTIEGGALVRRFSSLLDQRTGTVRHGGESFSYRLAQSVDRRAIDTAVMSTLRATVGLTRALYSGLEVDLGGLTGTGEVESQMMSTGVFGQPALQQRGGFVVDSLGIIGVRGGAGPGTLGVEFAGGLRVASYGVHSSYHDCETSGAVTALEGVAEARARGELWLGPWITAGAVIGASVIERSAWMAGVYVGVHSRAFGGGR